MKGRLIWFLALFPFALWAMEMLVRYSLDDPDTKTFLPPAIAAAGLGLIGPVAISRESPSGHSSTRDRSATFAGLICMVFGIVAWCFCLVLNLKKQLAPGLARGDEPRGVAIRSCHRPLHHWHCADHLEGGVMNDWVVGTLSLMLPLTAVGLVRALRVLTPRKTPDSKPALSPPTPERRSTTMAMTADERKFLEDQISEKYKWFNTGSRTWSFFYNGSLIGSAILSGLAAVVAKIAFFKDGVGLSDENIKDIVAVLAALATLVTTLTAGGGLGRKWQTNRVSRGRIERLRIAFSDPDAGAAKIRTELEDIIMKHDEAIVGSTVK